MRIILLAVCVVSLLALAVVIAYFRSHARPAAPQDSSITPLMKAAQDDSYSSIAYYLPHGADVSARDRSGRTALHYAALGGGRVVEALVHGGADVNAVDHSGDTPLLLALDPAHGGRDDAARALLNADAKLDIVPPGHDTPLILAAKDPKYDDLLGLVLQQAEPQHIDVNGRGLQGRTALHWASVMGRPAHVQALLDAGADPCIRDSSGALPSDLAHTTSADDAVRNNFASVRKLLEKRCTGKSAAETNP